MQDKTRQDPVTDESMNLRSRGSRNAGKPIDHLDVSTLPTKELQALVHELRVHQIELETQNSKQVLTFYQQSQLTNFCLPLFAKSLLLLWLIHET